MLHIFRRRLKRFFKVLSFENHGREPFLILKERPSTTALTDEKRGGIVLKMEPMVERKRSENAIYFCLLHHMLHLYPRRILVVNACSSRQHTYIDNIPFRYVSKYTLTES